MELLGHGFYYQDWHVGYSFRTLTRSVTETDIANFVGDLDTWRDGVSAHE